MRNHIERSTYYLGKELENLCQLFYYTEDVGNLPEIIETMPNKPDFILFNDMKSDYCPDIRNINQVSIPMGALVHDLHYRIPRRKRLYKDNHMYLFVNYRDAFMKWFPELIDQMIWFPHHVPADIFRDYQLQKKVDFLMIGSLISHLYPLRVKMFDGLQKEPSFKYIEHPGYEQITHQDKAIIGEVYAELLNQSKIFFTCDSIYQFPVLKYFETLGCRTLLLASGSEELKDLGFIDGETFVEVDEVDFYEKALNYLQNEEERERIATNGMNLVLERHTTSIRVKQLLDHIESILSR
jgi:hypothetical protein